MKNKLSLIFIGVLLIACTSTTKNCVRKPKKHCFNNLPEGTVINITDLYNNSVLQIRQFNSTQVAKTIIDIDDKNLRWNTFAEGDSIVHCNK